MVVEFHKLLGLCVAQRLWLYHTHVHVRRIAFNIDDTASATLLHDPKALVSIWLEAWLVDRLHMPATSIHIATELPDLLQHAVAIVLPACYWPSVEARMKLCCYYIPANRCDL